MSDDSTNPTPDADADVDTPDATPEDGTRTRAPRTNLETDVRVVCDAFVTGTLVLPEGKLLTPHAIAGAVMANRNDGSKVSGGAVAACLLRWNEIGYITTSAKPVAFLDYTDAGRTDGLGALKRQHSERLAAARAAVREAAKAANGAPGTGGTAAPAPAPADPADAPF
jgi:hypothetical protein